MPQFSLSDYLNPFLSTAIAINLGITVSVFLFSRLIGSPRWSAKANEFMFNSATLLLIIALFPLLSNFLSVVFSLFFCSNLGDLSNCVNYSYPSHFTFAQLYLSGLEEKLISIYSKMYFFESVSALISSVHMTFGVLMPNGFEVKLSGAPYVGINDVLNAYIKIIESVGYVAVVIISKIQILRIAPVFSLYVLLPLGILFRSLPFLSKTGSTIIALAFTLSFAFPSVLMLSSSLYSPFVENVVHQYTNTRILDDSKLLGSDALLLGICRTPPPDPNSQSSQDTISDLFYSNSLKELSFYKDISEIEQASPSSESPVSRISKAISYLFNIIKDTLSVIWSGVNSFITLLFNPTQVFSFDREFLKGGAGMGSGILAYVLLVHEMESASVFIVFALVTTILEYILIVAFHKSISVSLGGSSQVFGVMNLI